jgi:hypothetical protein
MDSPLEYGKAIGRKRADRENIGIVSLYTDLKKVSSIFQKRNQKLSICVQLRQRRISRLFFAMPGKKRELFLKRGVYAKCRKDSRRTIIRAAGPPGTVPIPFFNTDPF